MGESEERKTFGRNLTFYISKSGKDQKEVAKDLGFASTTFNTWCMGKIIPSMGKVQKIADYFGIGKSDLLDSHEEGGYYYDKETAKAAQEMFENKDLRVRKRTILQWTRSIFYEVAPFLPHAGI